MTEMTSAELAAKALTLATQIEPYRDTDLALVYATLSHAAAVREQTEAMRGATKPACDHKWSEWFNDQRFCRFCNVAESLIAANVGTK